MKYLGVQILKDLTSLVSRNYDPLLSNIRKELARWSLLPFLGHVQRITIVKMTIQGCYVYLFQSIPVDIPDKTFVEWDKRISKFLEAKSIDIRPSSSKGIKGV